jgi:hypothetical protein
LAFKTGLSRKEAFIAFLKEAGVWKEDRLAPSVMPGQQKRKRAIPEEGKEKAEGRRQNAEKPKTPPNVIQMPGDGLDGQNGQRGQDPTEGQPAPPENKALMVLREFYEMLPDLSEEDEEALWWKRGLTWEACLAYGLKSSAKSNKAILEKLREKYDEEVLVEAGLYKKKDGRCRPEPQLCGLGRTNKKDAAGNFIWDWTNPILIPYFDKYGELMAIRPHKGGVAGQPSRLYVARWRKNAGGRQNAEFKAAHCVVTEGEYKAMALHTVFDGKVGVAALPGIQQGKNYTVLEELKEWLRNDCAPEKLIVAFDSEEKGDPKLPGFKPDKRRRFDSEVWARYLAIKLEQSFCAARVCNLPKEWRDENGKADWDGALSGMLQGRIKL